MSRSPSTATFCFSEPIRTAEKHHTCTGAPETPNVVVWPRGLQNVVQHPFLEA